MATTMIRFPHTVPRPSGIKTLTPEIVKIRMESFLANVLRRDYAKADYILKDTLRVFHTAELNTFDYISYNYVMQNLLHISVEMRLGKWCDIVSRIYNMEQTLSLPASLM